MTSKKGGSLMKKKILGSILFALAFFITVSATAEVDIYGGIPLPPPMVFAAPPEVIVIPDTNYVYVVPTTDVDFFFWDGWWWRYWEGRWYRARDYDRGWAYYDTVPGFYFDIDPGWRGYYRTRYWYGHRWNYERIPYERLHRHWKSWKEERHWERQGTWGVQNYQPRPQHEMRELRHQRQEQYRQRPEVQRHQQLIQTQQRQPQTRPSEQGRTVRPQGGPAGRGEQQVEPEVKTGPKGGSAPKGEKMKVKQRKKMKPVVPERGPESRDEKRPGAPR
jgi:hypothetical protein